MSNGYVLGTPRLFSKYAYDWWWHHFYATNPKTGEERGFFLEFFVMNPSLNTPGPQFFPKTPCYVMVKCGCWPTPHCPRGKQINAFFPISALTASTDCLDLRIGPDISTTETRLTGCVEVERGYAKSRARLFSDSGRMSWDLRVKKKTSFDPGYATRGISRFVNLFDMFWYVKGTDAEYQGWIECDGQRFITRYATSYGYQDKNWGRSFTDPWLWLSCHCVKTHDGRVIRGASLVVGGTHPTVLHNAWFSDKHLLVFWHRPRHEPIVFNFTKPWTFGGETQWSVHRGRDRLTWRISCTREDTTLDIVVWCDHKSLINIHYEDPRGHIEFPKLFNGGYGRGTLTVNKTMTFLLERCGCEFGQV
ncbi:MAG: hypothetical protein FJ077_17150 [Cyanobacteria bacterium K_DeepCast_35m_m2_023]|nr:hypothetical protein [Cyanobacteria bacterium K_DeepCast_35m_m2_023]